MEIVKNLYLLAFRLSNGDIFRAGGF